jgi:catechol 2,3-dioxygenase-like lactoylglutathione lyase family enzyme
VIAMTAKQPAPVCASDRPAWSKPSTFSLTRIDHVALNVRDVDVSARWYRDRYGFTVLHAWTDPNIYMIGKGNIRIGLFEQKGAVSVDDPDHHLIIQHYAFAVDADQFQTVVDSYKADGIPYRVEDTGVAWSVWVADPDGFQVEVTCYYFPVTPEASDD